MPNTEDETERLASKDATDVRPEGPRFHTGEKLSLSEASDVLIGRPAKVVLCAGPSDSGKSTFLARVGETFRANAPTTLRFAGSLTLPAFERLSWLATFESGASRPDTLRTQRRENDTFLHLQLQDVVRQNDEVALLISDLAGETYPTALASRDFCEKLRALQRADHVAVFLDCAQLVNVGARHAEADLASTFLQRVSSIRTGSTRLAVDVVFSRWDHVALNSSPEQHESYCANVQNVLRARFSPHFTALRFWRVAARPQAGFPPSLAAIRDIIADWSRPETVASAAWERRPSQPTRLFSAYGVTKQ